MRSRSLKTTAACPIGAVARERVEPVARANTDA